MARKAQQKTVSVGGPARAVRTSLRISGDDLDPDDITNQLGVRPTLAQKKGDEIVDTGQQRVADTGVWLLAGKQSAHGTLEQEITAILDLLTDDLRVWHSLTRRFKVDCFCGVFFEQESSGGGFSLSPSLMKALVERNISIGFDLYWF